MPYRSAVAERRPRITFAGWQLGAYGGLETRVVTAAEIAVAAGYAVSVRTARPLVPGSRTELLLAGQDVWSVVGDWERRPGPRLARGAATAATMVRRRRRLSPDERSGIGHRWSMAANDRYWSGAGRELLERTDVLHLFGPPLPFLVQAMHAADSVGVPSVYQSVHAVTADYAANRWRRGFVETCNELDLILVSHSQQAADFREHFAYRGPTLELGQWAYGIEQELLGIARPRAADGPVVIGALCRLDAVKGLDSLIRAVAQASSAPAPVELRSGGDGPQEPDLRKLASELGVADQVRFEGFVEDRVAFYSSIDIFAITSLAEGGPVTGVEAMAAGLPIVSTPVGAMPDRLCDGIGMLTDGTQSSITSAVADLAQSAAMRSELGRMARRRYIEQFSEHEQSSLLRRAWSELTESRPDGTARPAGPTA